MPQSEYPATAGPTAPALDGSRGAARGAVRLGSTVAAWVTGLVPVPMLRTIFWIALIAAESLLLTALVDFRSYAPQALAALASPWGIVRVALVSAPVFGLLIWRSRAVFAAQWISGQSKHDPRHAVAINLALFALLLAASRWLEAPSADGTQPWLALVVWSLLLASSIVSLARIDVPLRVLGAVLSGYGGHIAAALATGLAMLLAAEQVASVGPRFAGSTIDLAAITFKLTAFFLGLFEPGLIVDAARQSLTIGNFTVIVEESCAGYEGLMLVAIFVTLYLCVARNAVRFPAVLALYPIGLGAIWILNSGRIAMLAMVGAHLSPEVAILGLHTRAGWINFLLVCMTMMWLTPKLPVFARSTVQRMATTPSSRSAGPISDQPISDRQVSDRQVSDHIMLGHLLPFTVLMLVSILLAALAPNDRPFYVVSVLAVGLTLFCYRDIHWSQEWGLSAVPLLAGLGVGAAWIATAPVPAEAPHLGQWLGTLDPRLALAWLVVRGVGAIVIVPITEELAFRSFLYRWIIARKFDAVATTQLSWVALVVSSLLFGLLHERWLAGFLAGVVFALLMLRRGRIIDAILAHGIANALIFGWALAFRQWSLI